MNKKFSTLLMSVLLTGAFTSVDAKTVTVTSAKEFEALIENERKKLFKNIKSDQEYPYTPNFLSENKLVYQMEFNKLSLLNIPFQQMRPDLRNTIIKRLLSAEFSSQVLRNGTEEGCISAESVSLHSSIDISEKDNKFDSDISADSSVLYFDTVGFIE